MSNNFALAYNTAIRDYMLEFSLSVSMENKLACDNLVESTKKFCNELGLIWTEYEKEDKKIVVIAGEEFDRQRIIYYLGECVSEIICCCFKSDFLSKRLNVCGDKQKQTALFSALLSFDKETDRYIVSKAFSIKRHLDLNSFFNFKLVYVAQKWQELVQTANDNCSLLASQDCFVELLKFLIDNLEIEIEEVNIVKGVDNYYLYDGSHQLLQEIKFEESEENLISNIIRYCPKKINLFIKENSSALSLLTEIFDRRVCTFPPTCF